MKHLIIILAGLYLSWRLTDLASEDVLSGMVAPIAVFVFLVALLAWLLIKTGLSGRDSAGGFYGGDGGGFGGDGGGGDGGC